jgi:hypothetical protein
MFNIKLLIKNIAWNNSNYLYPFNQVRGIVM